MKAKIMLNWCKWCESENGDRSLCPFGYPCEQDNWLHALENMKYTEKFTNKEEIKMNLKKILKKQYEESRKEKYSDCPF